MRKAVSLLALSMSLSGCFTYHWQVTDAEVQPEKGLPKDTIPAFISVQRDTDDPHHFRFQNKSDGVVFVSYKESVAEFGGRSLRVIAGDTKMIHVDQNSPDSPIAPHSTADIALYAQSSYEGGNSYKDQSADDNLLTFRVALTTSGKPTQFAVIHSRFREESDDCDTIVTEAPSDRRIKCILTLGFMCPKAPTESDIEAAQKQAKEECGSRSKVTFVKTTM